MSTWSEWSQCSAACGEGTRSRTRRVVRESQHGGEPCPEENIVQTTCSSHRPCDLDECKLGQWGQWSQCSRACGGGLEERTRSLLPVAGGSPELCPKLDDDQRREYFRCNNATCPAATTQPISCAAKLDIAIVLDGSGGCGADGFAETKTFVEALIKALDVGPEKTHVALVVAGGAKTFDGYQRCLQGGSLTDCNIGPTMPLSSDSAGVDLVLKSIAWPGGPGHLGGALAHAGAALAQAGRQTEGVPQIVLAVTRGRPLSTSRTLAAADNLRRRFRVAWVLLGEDAPAEEATRWASQPTRDNVIQFTSSEGLAPGTSSGGSFAEPAKVSQVISTMCPKVADPPAR